MPCVQYFFFIIIIITNSGHYHNQLVQNTHSENLMKMYRGHHRGIKPVNVNYVSRGLPKLYPITFLPF